MTWIAYPHDYQEIIETAYQNGNPDVHISTEGYLPFTLWKDITKCTIDFSQMKQTNMGGIEYPIHRDVKKIYIEGWLLRESRKLKMWRQVYIRLTKKELEQYNEDNLSFIDLCPSFNQPPSDTIPLQLIRHVEYEEQKYKITIYTYKHDNHTISLSAPSAYIASKWVYYLGLAQKKNLISKTKTKIGNFEVKKSTYDQDGKYSICFCSISTAAYKFPLEIASQLACDEFKQFLQLHPNAPIIIYLVDYIENSETINLFRSRKPDDNRFHVGHANLVQLKTFKMPSYYIVNASNPKFNEGGSGTNKAIHDACRSVYTPSLQTLTRRKYGDNAELSKAYPVFLPEGCPLRDEQNVRYVIHVVGPNMNPKKPFYLAGEDGMKRGEDELRKSYRNVLNCFWELTGLKD
jgi:O-acetyl-ADP-ribose deacetylase (regulator of RNase III)